MAQLLASHRYMPVTDLCDRLNISEATARRDLSALTKEKKILRTHGGALGEFTETFHSFRQRERHAQNAKERIATAALPHILPGSTCFFDAGTTILALARKLASTPVIPLTIVTNNIAVAETLGAVREFQVFLLGGQFFSRQAALLGREVKKALQEWKFDTAFLSAEGLNSKGAWNSHTDIVEFQNALLKRTKSTYLCVDATKLGRTVPHFLFSLRSISYLVTDASAEQLNRQDIRLSCTQLISTR